MNTEELKKILDDHKLWLEDSSKGGMADLSRANLSRANLSGANLSGANLDYSCWDLSCKTKNVKLCKKLQAQLLAHAFQVSPDCPMSEEQYNFIKENFHRFDEFFTRRLEEKNGKS